VRTAGVALWFNPATAVLVPHRQASRILNVSRRKPLIGIPADRRQLGLHPFHCVGEKYINAVIEAADAIPLLVPALGPRIDAAELLERLDGVLLTGSPSNVEPHRYAGPPSDPGTLHDPHRDETTLPLIPHLVASGMPVFAVCRGFQEMNVAFGGTLWQKVHEVPGFSMHKENTDDPLDRQYAPAHEVEFVPDGLLHRLAGGQARAMVNSLHSQGVQQLGKGLVVEARAPDGLIEAFRVEQASGFALAVRSVRCSGPQSPDGLRA
jgi:putative glutamine amidotransferase